MELWRREKGKKMFVNNIWKFIEKKFFPKDSINNCYSFIFCPGELSFPYEFQHRTWISTYTSLERALEIIEQETSWENAFCTPSRKPFSSKSNHWNIHLLKAYFFSYKQTPQCLNINLTFSEWNLYNLFVCLLPFHPKITENK